MHTHSLFELNEHIRRIMALNFQQPLWIVAELAQVGESRGHRYLDLVQKEITGEIIAQAQAAIWASEFRQINARMPQGLLPLLQEGLQLRMQVRPEFHERYGLKLHITDIDPAHTFGQLDLLRRKTIQTLLVPPMEPISMHLPLHDDQIGWYMHIPLQPLRNSL
jgi:exodeoxyribonuclease VII large subunit